MKAKYLKYTTTIGLKPTAVFVRVGFKHYDDGTSIATIDSARNGSELKRYGKISLKDYAYHSDIWDVDDVIFLQNALHLFGESICRDDKD